MKTILILVSLFGSIAFAESFTPVQTPKPEGRTTNQDLPAISGPSLNGGDRFEVSSYDPATRTYKLVLRADKSAGPLITTAENLAAAVPTIKLDKILKAPYSLVRFDYTVEDGKELALLLEDEVKARLSKAPAKTTAKSPEKPAKD